jgi:2-C-methyl-D-erythritol 4-phosphate cytidylyltransferase
MGTSDCWAVVPAAGVGRRMGGPLPKQYLKLAGRPVIDHTLERLLGHPRIRAVAVVLGAEDGWWPDTAFARHPDVIRAPGGTERCHSVLHGLRALAGLAGEQDWVLVHDAARPCLRGEDIDRLMGRLADHPVGGLLGLPVRDTMKRSDKAGEVLETVPRDNLWHAFTPQMFRLGMLREALRLALERGALVTDEASAMELAGHRPVMVEGQADNIKITRPQDLTLAQFYLNAPGERRGG